MGAYLSSLQTDSTLEHLETQAIISALPTEHWAVPAAKYSRFIILPAEIRELIITEYLHLERESGSLSKRCHLNIFR